MGQLVKDKLKEFSKFRNGWGPMGEGCDFSEEQINSVLEFWHKYIENKYDSNAFPGLGGEIMLTLYLKDGHYCELYFEADGTYSYIRENENEAIIEELCDLKYKDLVNIVKKLGG